MDFPPDFSFQYIFPIKKCSLGIQKSLKSKNAFSKGYSELIFT